VQKKQKNKWYVFVICYFIKKRLKCSGWEIKTSRLGTKPCCKWNWVNPCSTWIFFVGVHVRHWIECHERTEGWNWRRRREINTSDRREQQPRNQYSMDGDEYVQITTNRKIRANVECALTTVWTNANYGFFHEWWESLVRTVANNPTVKKMMTMTMTMTMGRMTVMKKWWTLGTRTGGVSRPANQRQWFIIKLPAQVLNHVGRKSSEAGGASNVPLEWYPSRGCWWMGKFEESDHGPSRLTL
jgi:hypothetical protein